MDKSVGTRRRYLRALGLMSIAGLAGCSSDDSGGEESNDAEEDNSGEENNGGEEDNSGEEDNGDDDSGDDGMTSDVQTEASELSADDADRGDSFGSSVAVSEDGTTAVIGASADEDPNGQNAGAAYVFEDSGGSWSQQAKLAADDGDDGDRFGISVAVSADGTTAVVGAQNDEDPNVEEQYEDFSGSAYVFEDSGGSWDQQAKLAADDGDHTDRFGSSVTISDDGTTAVIGAHDDEDPNGEYGDDGAGSAYVFEDMDGTWSQQAKLAADDGDGGDDFGASVTVAADGTTAVIGAWSDEDPNGDGAGSAYVFEDMDGSWGQQAKLSANDGSQYDDFGFSVSVTDDGTTAIIGSQGSAYVFNNSSGTWSQQADLNADATDFGLAVAISDDGTTAVIGADDDTDPNGEGENGAGAGSAFVFTESDDTWSQQTKLAADEGDPGDLFGATVAVSETGDTALVGASNHDSDDNVSGTGSTYVFDM